MKPEDIIEAILQMLERGKVTLDSEGYLVAIPPKVETPAADEDDLREKLMIELAYCKHADLPVSEIASRVLATIHGLSHPAADAMTD